MNNRAQPWRRQRWRRKASPVEMISARGWGPPWRGTPAVIWGEDALGLLSLLGLVQQQVCDFLTKFCLFCSLGRSEKEEGQLPGALAKALTTGLPDALTLGLPRGRHLSHNTTVLATALVRCKSLASSRPGPSHRCTGRS